MNVVEGFWKWNKLDLMLVTIEYQYPNDVTCHQQDRHVSGISVVHFSIKKSDNMILLSVPISLELPRKLRRYY